MSFSPELTKIFLGLRDGNKPSWGEVKSLPLKDYNLLCSYLKAARGKRAKDAPHLFRYKHFDWSRRFCYSENKRCIVTNGSQGHKSSFAIRKNVLWITRR